VQEQDQHGDLFEIWDGETFYDGEPSKSNSELITVVGHGTVLPVGLTLELLCKLVWRVEEFSVTVPHSLDGDINPAPGPLHAGTWNQIDFANIVCRAHNPFPLYAWNTPGGFTFPDVGNISESGIVGRSMVTGMFGGFTSPWHTSGYRAVKVGDLYYPTFGFECVYAYAYVDYHYEDEDIVSKLTSFLTVVGDPNLLSSLQSEAKYVDYHWIGPFETFISTRKIISVEGLQHVSDCIVKDHEGAELFRVPMFTYWPEGAPPFYGDLIYQVHKYWTYGGIYDEDTGERI
jgi:hypothetical protein